MIRPSPGLLNGIIFGWIGSDILDLLAKQMWIAGEKICGIFVNLHLKFVEADSTTNHRKEISITSPL